MALPKSSPVRRTYHAPKKSGFSSAQLIGVGVAVLVVIAFIAHHPQQARATRGPVERLYSPLQVDSLSVLEKLKAGKFSALDEQFKDFEATAANDPRAEMNLTYAFSVFALPDPEIAGKVREWIAQSPDSAIAHCARSIVLEQAAAKARGHEGGPTTSIPLEHFKDMEIALNRTVTEAESARAFDPNLISAWIPSIDAAKMESDTTTMDDLSRESLAKFPASFQLRRAIIIGMEPRWGGSYDAMDKFAHESQAFVAQNPMLRYLLGFAAMDQARELQADGKWEAAIPLLNKAIEVGGDYPSFYTYRGNSFYNLKKYDDALADFLCANDLLPDTPENLDMLALTEHVMNKPSDALEYSNLYMKLGEPDKEVADVHDWAVAQVLK
jgi:tetratricopeptide (TPR) repeat protein